MVKMYFLKLLLKIFVNIEKLFMADLLSNGLYFMKGNDMLYYYVILLKVD